MEPSYTSMDTTVNRRTFLKIGSATGSGILLGTPYLWAEEQEKTAKPHRPKTNLDEALAVPKTKHSLPGPFPGKVIHCQDENTLAEGKPNETAIDEMVQRGIMALTGKDMQTSFKLFFDKNDCVGIKVNPVGPGLISTRLEVVDAVINWLESNGLPRNRIVIWDRFDYMLTDAGFTSARYPGIGIAGLQTMDEAAASGEHKDNSAWLDENGNHISADNWDKEVYYWADVEAPQEPAYLNQHVFNNKYSYFGKLLTQKLTKIINIPVFKNTGNGISMASKNLGYGAICNTGRLHRPLFFNVCTEVSAFPVIRDKLVLNITDGLRAQYEGGPGANANFVYDYHSLFFATDPVALDMTCHQLLVEKRKEMNVKVNEHPRFSDYLRFAQQLELGIADPDQIEYAKI